MDYLHTKLLLNITPTRNKALGKPKSKPRAVPWSSRPSLGLGVSEDCVRLKVGQDRPLHVTRRGTDTSTSTSTGGYKMEMSNSNLTYIIMMMAVQRSTLNCWNWNAGEWHRHIMRYVSCWMCHEFLTFQFQFLVHCSILWDEVSVEQAFPQETWTWTGSGHNTVYKA